MVSLIPQLRFATRCVNKPRNINVFDDKRNTHPTHMLFAFLLLLQCFCWTLLTPSTAYAQSSARITLLSQTRDVYLGDVVVLDIESTGLLAPLDVDALKAMPEFLRETTGTRIAVVGGKVVEINIRRMEFSPTQNGVLFLGPLYGESTAGRVSSNTIDVAVRDAPTTQWQPTDSDLQSSITFSNVQPMVGEQVLVDIKLKHTHQIANENIALPGFDDFDVIPVIEQRRTIEADGRWRQILWRYLIHPKHSGEISIGNLSWTGTMIKSRAQRGDFNHAPTATEINVLPAPADRPDWWLPATSVRLSDEWSKDVRTLSAGDEIIRTITLTAHHVLGSQLPDIAPYPTRALTSTLIRTNREHQLNNDHTVATASFEYRMVAQSPIPVFLDTVRVQWWDVREGTHREAILPARRINVGLPDRADLLADMAVAESRWARFLLNLRSYVHWQSLLIALFSLAAILLLLPLMRDGIHLILLDRRKRRALAKLEGFRKAQDWQGLYAALSVAESQHDSEAALDTTSADYQSTMRALQQRLFSQENQAHAKPGQSQAETEQVLKQRIRLPFRVAANNKASARLASL